jgi:hypothetical protein
MSGEEDRMRFDIRTGSQNDIRFEERQITSDSMSREEDKIRFDIRTGR